MGCCQSKDEELSKLQVSLSVHATKLLTPRKHAMNQEATLSQTNNPFENNNNASTDCNINNKSTSPNQVPIQIYLYKKSSMKDLRSNEDLFQKGVGSEAVKRSFSHKTPKGKDCFDSFFKVTIKNYNILLSKPLLTHSKQHLTIDLDKYKHIFEDPHFTIASSQRKKSPFDSRRRSRTFLNTLTSI